MMRSHARRLGFAIVAGLAMLALALPLVFRGTSAGSAEHATRPLPEGIESAASTTPLASHEPAASDVRRSDASSTSGRRPLLAIRVEDDAPWRVLVPAPPILAAPRDRTQPKVEPQLVRRGAPIAVPFDGDAAPPVRAWIDAPFSPPLDLTPVPDHNGASLVLDARELLVSASLRVLRAEGGPWSSSRFRAELWEGFERSEARLESDAEGRVRFLLAPCAGEGRTRGLTLFLPADGAPHAHPVARRTQHSDRDEAHLALPHDFGSERAVDLGTLCFGEGPLLVRGAVVDAMGAPAPGAEVKVSGYGGACIADQHGRFERRGLPHARSARLTATRPESPLPAALEVVLPALDVVVALPRTASVRMRVEGPPGFLSSRLALVLRDPHAPAVELGVPSTNRKSAEVSFDALGAVHVQHLAIAPYELALMADGVEVYAFTHTLADGENDLGTVDLVPHVRRLSFCLANPAKKKGRVLITSSEEAIPRGGGGYVAFPESGKLDVWVPRSWTTWSIQSNRIRASGSVEQEQPIVIP